MTVFHKAFFGKLQPFLNAVTQLEKCMDICSVIKKTKMR